MIFDIWKSESDAEPSTPLSQEDLKQFQSHSFGFRDGSLLTSSAFFLLVFQKQGWGWYDTHLTSQGMTFWFAVPVRPLISGAVVGLFPISHSVETIWFPQSPVKLSEVQTFIDMSVKIVFRKCWLTNYYLVSVVSVESCSFSYQQLCLTSNNKALDSSFNSKHL